MTSGEELLYLGHGIWEREDDHLVPDQHLVVSTRDDHLVPPNDGADDGVLRKAGTTHGLAGDVGCFIDCELDGLGIGPGQVSRVDAVEIAVRKSGDSLEGAILASDAFFPFRDSIDRIAYCGLRAVIQPGGSVRDKEIIAACDEHGIAMVFTGTRCFKH